MIIRLLLTTLLSLGLFGLVSGQSFERKLFSNGGGENFVGPWLVAYSFGEPIVGTDLTGPPNLTKGFHQPDFLNSVLALPAPRPKVWQRGHDAELNWLYEKPAEIEFFILMRRLPGNSFEEVGRVTADLSSEYTFLDREVTTLGEDHLQYRVMAYSKGGELLESPTVELYLVRDGLFGLSVYPNPAAEQLFIETSGETRQLRFSLLNATGQSILSRHYTAQAGQKEEIDIRNLAAGIYWLHWDDGQGMEGNLPIRIED